MASRLQNCYDIRFIHKSDNFISKSKLFFKYAWKAMLLPLAFFSVNTNSLRRNEGSNNKQFFDLLAKVRETLPEN